MLFVGIAIAVALGLALIVNADAGAMFGLSPDQTAQALPLVILLAVFAGGLFSRRIRIGDMLSGIVMWVVLFGVAIGGYTYRDDLWRMGNRILGDLAPGAAVVDDETGLVSFRRGAGGHFHLKADVGGVPVNFLFDTGASVVVLTERDARAVGIDTDQLDYRIPVQTANGTGRAAAVTLDELSLGPISRQRVRAFVAQPGALETSLLGMSFLSTLTSYKVSGDRLELEG